VVALTPTDDLIARAEAAIDGPWVGVTLPYNLLAEAIATLKSTLGSNELIAGRIEHVRDICQTSIQHDSHRETGPTHWTDRHWLAQSVINILDGKIDYQIKAVTD
jgi:hypothetical protein